MPVSETEKHGVSTSGCRYKDKVEIIPIKKRRFLLRSPSPPPVKTSPCAEETADHTKGRGVSEKIVPSGVILGLTVDNTDSLDIKNSVKPDIRLTEDEDFSGISILAAAACSSSLGRDCGFAQDVLGVEESSGMERDIEASANTEAHTSSKGFSKDDVLNSSEMSSGATSSCISTEPVGELASISTTVNSSQEVATIGKVVEEAPLGAYSLNFSEDVSCTKEEELARNPRLSSRDERLHWDLNVVMDAWEQPFDDSNAQDDVSRILFEHPGKANHSDNAQTGEHYSQDNLGTVYASQRCLLPEEPRTLTSQSNENHDMNACLNLEQPPVVNDKSLPSSSNRNFDVMNYKVEITKDERREETVNPTDGLVVAVPDGMMHVLESSTMIESEGAPLKILNLNDERSGHHSVVEGFKSNIGVPSCDLQNLENTGASDANLGVVSANTHISLCVSSILDTLIEREPNIGVSEALETPKMLHREGNDLVENVDLKMVEPQEHTEFAISNDTSLSDLEALNSMPKRCELLVALDTKVQISSNIISNIRKINNLSEILPVNLNNSCDTYYLETCNANLETCSNYSSIYDHVNDVGVNFHPILMTGTDSVGELQEGYDSQYEDGELRESSVRAWEKYDREAEDVDNFSKYKEPYSANPSDYHALDSGQVVDRKSGSLGVGRPVSFDDCNVDYDVYGRAADATGNDRGHDEGNQLKLSHVGEKTEQSLGKEKLKCSKSFSDVATLGADDNGGKDKIPSHLIDRYLDSGGTETRTESRAFRGLQSQVEGPVGRDDISRDEQVKKLDNRFDSGSMRSFERLPYSFHNQVRGRQGASWEGSSDGRRGFRRHYSPIMRGNRKLNDDAVVDRDDLRCIDTPNDAPYSQQLNRSGAEVESCVGFNSRFKADRKFSPDRGGGFGRGRPFRYGPFGESRGGRGRFNGPSPDETFHYSLKYRRPLSRRERSLSPFGVGEQSNIHHSRRKSPPHSRSRSPIIWNSPRRRPGTGSGGGNTFLRHRSRSPNFRSEARMQRPRSPHQQPDFGVDHAGGFRTISRNHGSPRRWTSARKDEMGKFREIGYKQRTLDLDRSPGRIHLKSNRDNDVDSPRSLKPDGFYRMSDRIPGDAGRGVRYEENYEDRRKQYNPFRPTRRNYDDDVNDSFSMPNSFRHRGASSFQDRGLRSIDNRLSDLPRKFRGDNHSFIYERDGKYKNNSKQFGLDGMNSSHNLKSDEQYRPNYAGRFSDVSGTSRGSRYENYEDRRKRCSETNIMRRNDKEDTEKRLNDNENFEDTCGRDTRGFDGRIGSFLTRFREDEEPVMSGQEEKLNVNSQPVVQNSGENDATKEVVSS